MLGKPESWAPPSAAKRLRLSSEAETSRVATLLQSCPGCPSPVEGGGGRSEEDPGPQALLSGSSLDIGFWTRLPRPCVGGVRGWSGKQEVSADGLLGQLCREQSTSVWMTAVGPLPTTSKPSLLVH